MIKEEDFKRVVADAHKYTAEVGRKKTLAEIICEIYQDKLVSIYLGDEFETLDWEGVSLRKISVIIGRIVTAYAECLIVDCAYIKGFKNKEASFGNILCINERGIRMLSELGTGTLDEAMLSSKDSNLIENLFRNKKI